MALIKCEECGKEISSKANTCIHCGNPINNSSNLQMKKVVIKKGFSLALRTSVFIDNQPVGEIGIGANKNIEIELPIGTHYIGLNTNVKHGDLLSPMAVSNESDGKQFSIKENDEVVVIEILAKGSWSGSTGRCIVGNITTYDKNNMDKATITSNNSSSSTFFQRHMALITALVIIFLFLFLYFNSMIGSRKMILLLVLTISIVFFLINEKKKK